MDNTEQQELIDQINTKTKIISTKIREEQERKERLQREEDEQKSKYIKELKELFSNLDEYNHVIDISNWMDLCILDRYLIINQEDIFTMNNPDLLQKYNKNELLINELETWGFDYVSRLYKDRFKILEVINDQLRP